MAPIPMAPIPTAVSDARPPTARTEPGRLYAAAALFAGFALWLIMRPYLGLAGDSRLYIGQALASLHPASIGQDFLFARDGQFSFTVFPWLAQGLVALFGASAAALVLSLTGLTLWFAALVALSRRLAPGAGAWLVVAAVVLLPGGYDGFNAFHIGEALATPRVFAEAFCILALAALLGRRVILALGLLAVGFGFHPIMAIVAAGAAIVYLCLGDRRWLWAPAAGLVGLCLALALRLPIAERLLTIVPSAWVEIIATRSDIILPSHWPAAFWSAQAVHAVTIALAARRSDPRTARLLWSGLVVGAGGLAVGWTLGDHWPLLLIMQLQPWRALWVMTLLAGAGLALIGLERRREGGLTPALPMLIGAWAFADRPLVALLLLAAALLVEIQQARGRAMGPAVVRATWLVVLVLILAQAALVISVIAAIGAHRPAGAEVPLQVWGAAVDALAMALVCGLLSAARRPAVGARALLAGALALLVLAGATWDRRSSAQRDLERPSVGQRLRRIMAGRPGEVLWVEGDIQPWLWLDRPSWVSSMQGAGVVFSRPLAQLWDERTRRAVDAGLMSSASRAPFQALAPRSPAPTPAQLDRFCAAADAPAWIVLPGSGREAALAAGAVAVWRPPHPTYRLSFAGRNLSWDGGSQLFVLACRGAGGAAPA